MYAPETRTVYVRSTWPAKKCALSL